MPRKQPQEKYKICQQCGHQDTLAGNVCSKCSGLKDPTKSRTSIADRFCRPKKPLPMQKFCPGCGRTSTSEGTSFCPACDKHNTAVLAEAAENECLCPNCTRRPVVIPNRFCSTCMMIGGAPPPEDDLSFRECFEAPELRRRKTKALPKALPEACLVPDNNEKNCRDFTVRGDGSIWIRLGNHVIRLRRLLPETRIEIYKGEDVGQEPCQSIIL